MNSESLNMSSDFIAALELLKMLLVEPRTAVLIALLIAAALIDIKSNRIPNWLVFGGALFGLVYNGFFPAFERESGWLLAIEGLGVGLGMLLPFYMLRAMGAGDVKLMAMVGAFLGPWHTFMAVLATFLAGGVLAIGFLIAKGSLRRGLLNIFLIGHGAMLDVAVRSKPVLALDANVSAGKLPYGVAIAAGTISYLVLKQFGIV
jgi:prepilin peptidase CpaA